MAENHFWKTEKSAEIWSFLAWSNKIRDTWNLRLIADLPLKIFATFEVVGNRKLKS